MARNTREGPRRRVLALISSARRLFISKRAMPTRLTPDIVVPQRCDPRCALSSFRDKKALFRAVIERKRWRSHPTSIMACTVATPREALMSGASAYFAAMAVEAVRALCC